MNLYKISQSVNNGYDTYDSAVVAAESEEAAKLMHPDNDYMGDLTEWYNGEPYMRHTWAHPKDVQVQYIGVAAPDIEAGVLVASFNAG